MKSFLLLLSILLFLACFTNKAGAQGTQTVGNGTPTAPINFPGTGCTYFWVNSNPSIGLPASGAGNIPSFIALNNGATPITATITATPEPTGYAFIANYNDGTVSVINTATGTVVKTISIPSRPIGVDVNSNLERFVVTKSGTNKIQAVNTTTDGLVMDPDSAIVVGSVPWGIVITPNNTYRYVANSGSGNVSVINSVTLALATTIKVGISPKGLALSPDGKTLYVTNSGSNSVSVISTATNTVTATIPLAASPLGVATSPDGKTVYVATDGTTGAVVAINTLTNLITATIAVGSQPVEVAVTDDSSLVYVTNSGSNSVSVINTNLNTVVSTIAVGLYPFGISITPDGAQVYVINQNSNNVSVISTVTGAVVNTIKVGNKPTSFGHFIVGSGSGCSSFPVKATIIVDPGIPPPLIMAAAAEGTISACIGVASTSPDLQQFTVSGIQLTGNIIATAPAGFEVSLLPGSGFGASVALAQAGGTVSNTLVYVRSGSSAPSGNITGSVVLTTPGGANKNVAVNGNINPLPTMNKVPPEIVTGGMPSTAIHFTGTGNSFNWVNDTPAIGLPAFGTGDIASFTAVNNSGSPVVATITVTPAYSNFAYVPNFGDGTISVINVSGKAVVTTLKTGGTPYAVTVSPDGSRVFVSDEYANTVSVINALTSTILSIFPVGADPSCLVVSPDGKQLYVVNSYANSVWVINASTNAIIFKIGVGRNPQAMAVSPDGKTLCVTNSVDNTVSVINTVSGAVTTTFSVGSTPSGIVVSPDGSKLYVANATANTVSVINTTTNTLQATVPVGKNPQGLAISPDGHVLYVVNNTSNSVSVINTASNSVTTSIPVGSSPFGISISPDGGFVYVPNAGSDNVSAISTETNSVITTITVGSQPDSFGNFITANSSGCTGPPITFTITVNPAPIVNTIVASGTPAALSTTYGTPSTATVFTVSGIKMTAGILVTPPTGFEVSTDDITFKKTITIGAAGTIAPIAVYIRLSATTPVGDYSGPIALTSAGATAVNVIMPTSTVVPTDLAITADDKRKAFGDPNPPLTASYSGFVNGETAAVLTALPVLATTAIITSPIGQYPITAGGAASPNYTIAYIAGILTVIPAEQSILIPNTFTPNGDGVNDTWNIQSLSAYLNCSVDIFNRWGGKVYSSIGYSIPWDGTSKGTALPPGTYYYIINLKTGHRLLSGFVVIIR